MNHITVSIESGTGRSPLTTKFIVAEDFPFALHFMHAGHLVAQLATFASNLWFIYFYFHRLSTKTKLD